MIGIAGAIGMQAGSDLLGSFVNWGMAASQNKKQREWEERMIKEQNEYNSPKSQMERYADAGLNPHLIYGQGTPGLQTQTAKGKFDLPPMQRMDLLGAYNDFTIKDAQKNLINDQRQVEQAKAEQIFLDNADKFLEYLWKWGAGVTNIPLPPRFDGLVSVDPHVEGYRESQQQAITLSNQQKMEAIKLLTHRLSLTKNQAKWLETVIFEWDTNKININKDDAFTRSLMQNFGGAGSAGNQSAKMLMMLINALARRR